MIGTIGIDQWRSMAIRGEKYAMTIYDTDDEGNIIVIYDSRWRYPETLGLKPTDPEYTELQALWEKTTGEKIPERRENSDGICDDHSL